MLISSIYRNILRLKDTEMSELGLKGTHLTCLFYLFTSDVKTAAELSKQSGEDKAAISRSIEFLSKGGFIEADGNYRKFLSLTDKGRQTAQYIVNKVNEFVDAISGDMTEDERKIFYKALNNVSENLKKITEGESR